MTIDEKGFHENLDCEIASIQLQENIRRDAPYLPLESTPAIFEIIDACSPEAGQDNNDYDDNNYGDKTVIREFDISDEILWKR